MKKNIACAHNNLLFKITMLFISMVFIGNKPTIAQDKLAVKFGSVSLADFNLPKSNAIDSNTNAVIIANVGSTEFVGNKYNWMSYVLKTSMRIKILNNKANDLATVKIFLYGKDEWQDKLSSFQATTYNTENGKVVETKVKNEDLFTEKVSKNTIVKKFTFPNIKDGSIIEYSYTINSRHIWVLPDWDFQQVAYPSLYSEYQIGIPDMLRYSVVRHGIDSFSSSKNEESFGHMVMDRYETSDVSHYEVATAIHKQKWTMKNIAAIKHEDYVNYPRDYLDKLSFNLSQTYNGTEINNIGTGWKTVETELLNEQDFGGAIETANSANLFNTVKKIGGDDANAGEAAKKIYYYIRDNFTCVPNNAIYTFKNLYDVNQTKSGSVADLNLLLIAMLRQRGLKAYPVILSTKNYGSNPSRFPIITKMNYLVCMLKIFGDTIYLDASNPIIGFGKLPLACYNGHARIIDEHESGSLFFNSNAIKEKKVTSIFMVNDEKGNGASASFQSDLGYFGSYDLRNTVRAKGEKEYLKSLQSAYGSDVEIANLQIDSLTRLEDPVKVNYDINFKANNGEDIIYFNPVIESIYKENPFKATDRKYPIEMSYPIDDMYVLNMEIPKGYKVDELPKSVQVAFNIYGGLFEYSIQNDERTIQLRTHIKIRQAIIAAEDYNALRAFFAYIVKKQSEQIVFKKK